MPQTFGLVCTQLSFAPFITQFPAPQAVSQLAGALLIGLPGVSEKKQLDCDESPVHMSTLQTVPAGANALALVEQLAEGPPHGPAAQVQVQGPVPDTTGVLPSAQKPEVGAVAM